MEWSLTAGHSYRREQTQKWRSPWKKVNKEKSCWLKDWPGDTKGLKHNRETEPAGTMFKLGIVSRFGASVPARENGTQWHSHKVYGECSLLLCQMISTAYTSKSSFTPGGTPWLNRSPADYEEYSVSWSEQDMQSPECRQVSSLNLIGAILTSISIDTIIIVCKYTSAYVKHAWASQEEL